MKHYTSRKYLTKTALERWENEGGKTCLGEISPVDCDRSAEKEAEFRSRIPEQISGARKFAMLKEITRELPSFGFITHD